MILEHAVLDVVPGEGQRFEEAFERAQSIIASMQGFRSLQLQRCVETPSRYLLLVEWHRHIAEHWTAMLETSVSRIDAFRAAHPEHPILDVRYADLTQNPVETVACIYDAVGDRLDEEARAAMESYVTADRKEKLGCTATTWPSSVSTKPRSPSGSPPTSAATTSHSSADRRRSLSGAGAYPAQPSRPSRLLSQVSIRSSGVISTTAVGTS